MPNSTDSALFRWVVGPGQTSTLYYNISILFIATGAVPFVDFEILRFHSVATLEGVLYCFAEPLEAGRISAPGSIGVFNVNHSASLAFDGDNGSQYPFLDFALWTGENAIANWTADVEPCGVPCVLDLFSFMCATPIDPANCLPRS